MKKIFQLALIVSSLFVAQGVFANEPAAKPAAPAAATVAASGQVNINAADAATLADQLDGVGEVKAKAIVEYRTQNGPFKSVEDLANVTGIGEATIEKNKAKITLQ